MTPVTGPGYDVDGHNAGGSPGGAGLPPVSSIPLTEEDAASVAAEQSVGGLVRDAMTHLSTLLRAEIELAKLELLAEVRKARTGSVFFLAALTVLLFSLFFFFFAVAELLADLGLYRSAAFGIVFFVMLLATAGLGLLGYRKVRGIRAPRRTIESVRDTVAALRHPGER
ncbi:MAG: phage holin family protein [Kutzneria sp.]|nr:phage holin family protein [Kutzneria sp.]MBV9845717.1 phage holin family protein [Kutzneria sp.]